MGRCCIIELRVTENYCLSFQRGVAIVFRWGGQRNACGHFLDCLGFGFGCSLGNSNFFIVIIHHEVMVVEEFSTDLISVGVVILQDAPKKRMLWFHSHETCKKMQSPTPGIRHR